MYELAFAAAATGYEVELRGWLERGEFARMHDSLGIAPFVDLPARRPHADDVVIVPEGWQSPFEYARLYLSGARLAVFLLAPPGLFGWPFCVPGWTPPDPLTVALDSVGTPVQFQAMQQLGIPLLTHSPGSSPPRRPQGLRARSSAPAGRPLSTATAGRAQLDVAAVLANRWAPLVEQVADQLDGLSVDLVDEASNAEVLSRLSRARVLLWPSRSRGPRHDPMGGQDGRLCARRAVDKSLRRGPERKDRRRDRRKCAGAGACDTGSRVGRPVVARTFQARGRLGAAGGRLEFLRRPSWKLSGCPTATNAGTRCSGGDGGGIAAVA